MIFIIFKLRKVWRVLFPSYLVWVEDWHSAPYEYTPVLVACFRQQDNVAWWLHHCVDCWPHECTFQSNSLLHREWGDHPKRHLVPYMSGNQPMFHGHGQSDTDLFHSTVRRDTINTWNQNSFWTGPSPIQGNLHEKINLFTVERSVITFERGEQMAKAKTNIT